MENAKGLLVGNNERGTQPFVCGFRGAFYITPPEGNFICSGLFVCAAETGLFTPRPGHVFIYIPKVQNILNHTRGHGGQTLEGTWLTSAGDSAKAAQSTLNITLKK